MAKRKIISSDDKILNELVEVEEEDGPSTESIIMLVVTLTITISLLSCLFCFICYISKRFGQEQWEERDNRQSHYQSEKHSNLQQNLTEVRWQGKSIMNKNNENFL